MPQVMQLVRELAEYERAPHEVTNTDSEMLKDGFGENAVFGLFVAEMNGDIVGIALHYVRYSTWKGPVLYLEDIVVKESSRRKGVGTALLNHLIAFAKKRKFERISWQVLDWNQPAIDFYKKFDVNFDETWINVTHQLN